MSVQISDSSSLTGLARRWLKTQLQFHGNPQRSFRDRQEAEAVEHEMRERASDEFGRAIFNAVLPSDVKRKLTSLEEQREIQQLARSERRHAEQRALPRAAVSLTFRGAIRGTVRMDMPVRIEWPGEDGVFVVVELTPLEPISVGDRQFGGLRIALPAKEAQSGGSVNLAKAAVRHARQWDPLDAQVWFDESDDSFFWSEDYGSAHFGPAPGLDMLQFLMPIQNSAGERVSIEGSMTFTNLTEN